MRELRLFGPFGNLGYGGVSDDVWKRTIEWQPHAIFQQGTSSDPGRGTSTGRDGRSSLLRQPFALATHQLTEDSS